MGTTIFKGERYREAANLWCPVSKGPLIEGKLFVGPRAPEWDELKAMLLVTQSPAYSGPFLFEDTYGPWSNDLPPESFEAAAILLAARHGFTCGPMEHRVSAWGRPIKRRTK